MHVPFVHWLPSRANKRFKAYFLYFAKINADISPFTEQSPAHGVSLHRVGASESQRFSTQSRYLFPSNKMALFASHRQEIHYLPFALIATPSKCQLMRCKLPKSPTLHAHRLLGNNGHIGNQKNDCQPPVLSLVCNLQVETCSS